MEMLRAYSASRALRLHMPGHKGKFPNWKTDITELAFSDNLMNPSGAIARSEELFAAEWGAKRAIYLVNGSTAGIFSMLANARGSVLMQRSSHNSAYNAVRLYGKTAYVLNDYDENMLSNDISVEDIGEAVSLHPDIKTLFLTSPNYYGKVLDLNGISRFAREKGLALFVDSAHGAHFGLSETLPPPAHKFADAAVVSTHKTLPALTQTAVLLTSCENSAQKLRESVNELATTSPSYPLLASIDYARAYADKHRWKYAGLKKDVGAFCAALPDGVARVHSDDFTRLVLDVTGAGLTGFQAEKMLNAQNIFPEFADKRRVVSILTLCDGAKTLKRYLSGFKTLIAGGRGVPAENHEKPHTFDKITRLCFNEKVKRMDLKQSEGLVSAANAGIMPPCAPVIVAGEVIQKWQIDTLSEGFVFGVADGKILVAD